MSEQTQAVIEAVTSKEGATNGKAWRRFSVKTEDGTFYTTFQKDIAQAAHNLVGQRAEILWTPSKKDPQYRDIIGARAVTGAAAIQNGHGAPVTPGLGSEPQVDVGSPAAAASAKAPNWDEIGLRKTRCLLWAEYLGSQIAAAVYDGGGRDEVYRAGVDLITKAERDIYWRAPADEIEDIPFG